MGLLLYLLQLYRRCDPVCFGFQELPEGFAEYAGLKQL
jgi:hypothetical protein